jgi:hypothetical protein
MENISVIKCQGNKKVDWIENIIGVTKNKPEESDIMKEWAKAAAEQIAKNIDKEIVESILNEEKPKDEENKISSETIIKDIHMIQAKWNIS